MAALRAVVAARKRLMAGCACAWLAGSYAQAPPEPSVRTGVVSLSAAFDAGSLGLHCTPQVAPWWPQRTQAPALRPKRLSPRDCLVAQDNPPVWVWPPHPQADAQSAYTLHLRHLGSGHDLQFTSRWPYLYPPAPLPPGDYTWHVQWHGQPQGQSQEQSQGRGSTERSSTQRLHIDARAPTANWPSAEAVVRTARERARPRLLPEGAAWAALRKAAVQPSGPRHDLYRAWQVWADALVSSPSQGNDTMAAEPRDEARPADPQRSYELQRHAVQAAGQMYREIVRLAVLGHLADNITWRRAATERLMRLAAWSADGPTSEAREDLANRFATHALAIGYDLLFNELSEAQKVQVQTQVMRRLAQQHQRTFATLQQGQWPYDSHGIPGTTYAAAVALLMAGSSQEHDRLAADYIRWVVPNALAWGEQDGSDGNGHFYGWLNQAYAVQAALVLDRVGGLRLQQRGVMRNAPLWQAAFTPTPSPSLAARSSVVPSFGDGSDPTHSYFHEYHTTISRFFADLLPPGEGQATAQRLWQTSPGQALRTQQDPLYLLAPMNQSDSPTLPAPQRTHVFPDSGLVAVHSSASDPARSSLYFRAHHFGAFNHAMGDNGSFVLWVSGEPMLVNSGYYDFHGSLHHRRYSRRTQAKNALTVDGGRGQLETSSHEVVQAATPGVGLLAFADTGDATLASADLTAAYRPAVSAADGTQQLGPPLMRRYVRTVVRDQRHRTTVVIDAANSDAPRTHELNFHALQPWRLHASDKGVWQTSNAAATICLSVHDAQAQQWLGERTDRFLDGAWQEVLPVVQHKPQHHLALITTARSTTLRAVTLIRDDCTQPAPGVQWSDERDAVRLTYPDGSVVEINKLAL
jgi:hypothetical protein